jgi:hypothetical protein
MEKKERHINTKTRRVVKKKKTKGETNAEEKRGAAGASCVC